MPPNIKFYADPDLKVEHDGRLRRVKKGEVTEATIYCVNQGDGTLLDPTVRLVKSVTGPVQAQILNSPPKALAPGDKWAAKIQWVGEGKWGTRKVFLHVDGEHVD